jgi:hypothetical protein
LGAGAKIAALIILIVIVGLAVWQFTSPALLPQVGTKYSAPGPYSAQGSWTTVQTLNRGTITLAISVANFTYPKLGIETDYWIVISDVNQTLTSSYFKGYGIKVTALTLQDSIDGSTNRMNKGPLTDAVETTTLFFFKTSATHQLRFTITYQVYDLLQPIGSLPDNMFSSSFNITQTVI